MTGRPATDRATLHDPNSGPLVTSRRGFFWIGAEAVELADGGVAPRGPMYVRWEAPAAPARPLPIVLIHGGGGQGTDWIGTPDGRAGWATELVLEGWTVYTLDRPGHGRSPWYPDAYGAVSAPLPREAFKAIFAPSQDDRDAQTQWPGSGVPGEDPALDQLLASAGPMLRDVAAAHRLEQVRARQLLEKIGPAVVFTHSAGGPMAWLALDACPDLVEAVVAIEPLGPPFVSRPDLGLSLDWGLAAAPLRYDPPVTDPRQLRDGREPPRRLPNLARSPIAVVAGEASPREPVSHEVVAFLREAGCTVTHLALADHGLHGNGHAAMAERNSSAALRVVLDWLDQNVLGVRR